MQKTTKEVILYSFFIFYMGTCVWYLKTDSWFLFFWFLPLKLITILTMCYGIEDTINKGVHHERETKGNNSQDSQ